MSGDESYLDAEQDLLGGIEAGISRGQTLKEAMVSLYNSGYEKPEIEKAARAYLDIVNKRKSPGVFPDEVSSSGSKEDKEKEKSKDKLKEKDKSEKDKSKESTTKSPQAVSSYGEDSKKKEKKKKKFELGKNAPKEEDPSKKEEARSKAATYILVGILFFLLLALAMVFLFKDELVRFINNLFG